MTGTGIVGQVPSSQTGRFLAIFTSLLALSLACLGVSAWADAVDAIGRPIVWAMLGMGIFCFLTAVCMAGYTLVARPDILMPQVRVVTRMQRPHTEPAARRCNAKSRTPERD